MNKHAMFFLLISTASAAAMPLYVIPPSENAPLTTSKKPTMINYLVRITNNSDKPFKINCYTFMWRRFVYSNPQELSSINTLPATPEEAELTKLQNEQSDLEQQLNMVGKTAEEIADNPRVKAYQVKINELLDKMTPVVQPHSTATDLPCRLYSIYDEPMPKPLGWKTPETFISDDSIKIMLINTAHQGSCPQNNIEIQAISKNHKASCCVDTQLGTMGRVHLIINADETFNLIPDVEQPLVGSKWFYR